MSYAWKSFGSESVYADKMQMVSLDSFGDVLLRFRPGNGRFAVEPLVGYSVASYVWSKVKSHYYDKSVDLFDKKNPEHFSRFVVRGRVGLNLAYDDIFVGVRYSIDVNEFQRHNSCRSRVWEATLGYRF